MSICAYRFSDLTGSDYSEAAIDLARRLAERDGFSNIKFLVCFLIFLPMLCSVVAQQSLWVLLISISYANCIMIFQS